jgi:hypothetical protein
VQELGLEIRTIVLFGNDLAVDISGVGWRFVDWQGATVEKPISQPLS